MQLKYASFLFPAALMFTAAANPQPKLGGHPHITVEAASKDDATKRIAEEIGNFFYNWEMRTSLHPNIGKWLITVSLPEAEKLAPDEIPKQVTLSMERKDKKSVELTYQHPLNHNHPTMRALTSELYIITKGAIVRAATGKDPGKFMKQYPSL